MKKFRRFSLLLIPAMIAVFAAGCNNRTTSPTAPTATSTGTSTVTVNTATVTRTSTAVITNTATATTTGTTVIVNTATATSTMTQPVPTDTVTNTPTQTPTATITVTATATITATNTTGPAILVPIGSASTYGVLGGSAGATNAGIYTFVDGDIGTTGASSMVTGFHDSNMDVYTETTLNIGEVTGTVYCAAPSPGTLAKAELAQAAIDDAAAAYLYLSTLPAGSDPNGANPGELGGLTLYPGTYTSAGGTFQITGSDLTLDGQGDLNAVFVFQMASSLTVGDTAPRSVILINNAQAANVYWQVGSNAVINAASGGIMAGTIICNAGAAFSTAGLTTLTTLDGRALSLGASVTLVNTVINAQ